MICDDFRQSLQFQRLLSESGSCIIELGHGEVGFSRRCGFLRFLNMLIIPRVLHPEILRTVENLPYKYRSLFTAIAPKAVTGSENAQAWKVALKQFNYRPAKFGLAPTKTLELDLSLNEQELLQQMKSKTRYNIRLAQRKGVKTEIINGDQMLTDTGYLEKFYQIYYDNCCRIRLKSDTKEDIQKLLRAFQQHCSIIFGYVNEDEVGAVALYLVTGNAIIYQMNGSTEKGRKYFATDLVVWEGILEGKRRGCHWFDFDGIYDERFKKGQRAWHGFSRFKLGFGGMERRYMGSYIKWFPFLKLTN